MSFCTTVNCMDGRVQLPVIKYLQDRFDVPYVDSVTEAGPIRVLSEAPESQVGESIMSRVAVSTGKHGSRVVSVVGHADCAGNPVDEATQRTQLVAAMDALAARFPEVLILGLWVSEDWSVHEVDVRTPRQDHGA